MEVDVATLPFLLLALALAVAIFLLLRRGTKGNDAKTETTRLPPGPPALVFLAKFLALRRSIFDLGPLLRELHARYGPVISVRVFRTLVFVADRHLAHRVLVQGGATFADRPPPVETARLFSSGGDISGSPYGAYWRLVRRNLAGEALHPSRVARFEPARRRVCDTLVQKLLPNKNGEREEVVTTLRPLLRRAMFELLVYMCFGAWLEQEALDEIEHLQHQVLLSVTTFPVFAFFPAVTKRLFRKRWEAYEAVRRRQDEVFVQLIHHRDGGRDKDKDVPLIHHRGGGRDDKDKDHPPCYADSLRALRVPGEEGDRPLSDAAMVSLCSEFLNGGTDTTVTLVEWIMAELVNRPDVQARLRAELVKKSAAPDQPHEYLKAVVLEGLRLHPPGHFVLPHGVQRDAEVGGYTVPKGAEVNFPVAEIGRDATVWTAPLEFRPERFLEGGEGCGVDITGSREIRMMPFGAGRRMCPGYVLGTHHAEYFVARMVRDLEWRPPGEGQPAVDMEEVLDFTHVMRHPLRARIVPIPPHQSISTKLVN